VRVRISLLVGAVAALTLACQSAPPPTADQQLIAQKGCGACHTIPGVPGANGVIGPNLAGVASRTSIAGGGVPNNGPDDLKRWILDPPAVKPGTSMPKLGLTDEEATRIVNYLETLK
jgi:cytochrome c